MKALLIALAAFSGTLALAEDSVPSVVDHATPERMIEALKASRGVLPPVPDVHPKRILSNAEAVVPPQCYTQTEARYNPCYVCHQDPINGRENVLGDGDLQRDYAFSDLGMTNHWKNLFEDRSERVAAMTDEEILAYIRQDNYSELPGRLREVDFDGWIPDLADLQLGDAAFDAHGFARDGSGWVAFNYKPLPSTFWPTNGSTDDVMIRLPLAYRTLSDGSPSLDVYRSNLAILEAQIKGLDSISCLPVDEKALAVDLDGNGTLGTATRITRLDSWTGAAAGEFIDTFLYPKGTEFLHTVRYVGIDDTGKIGVSTRMKEVRYLRKARAANKPVYARRYQEEGYEKDAGNLPDYLGLGNKGIDNKSGWAVQGFIENAEGRLRALTFEENFSCMSCHNAIGSTIDKTFAFPRKIDGSAGWGYINLKGMPDAPSKGERTGEIATYLARVGGGSEFRNNPEMEDRWFSRGRVDHQKLASAKDVYDLITPSRERALALNKAYRCIVQDQDFINGKDATISPPKNVYDAIDNDKTPTLPDDRVFSYNLLLEWPESS
ncbi:hypothetical protein HNR46_000512 [Haloferula luteola]|uniref:Lipoprotein n=1 Tax=Haloferula luteola TaxID=595692 RepID=A0A840V677_9BACT|nr:hypothetical protein [Haloferula luteola]MBB5350288.1 hypothetical protein [Haloferula luteola]